IPGHPLMFSQNTGMQIDGGAGGSRSQPQHSFRLELAHSVLGGSPVNQVIIPGRPNRNKYSEFYLRNGSNQYLVLPYKEACQAELMCRGANAYYSAYRPATVYINGQYFGLYELREKYNAEMFKENEGAIKDSVELMSLSYWYGGMLRAVQGSTANFWNSYNAFNALNEASPTYWSEAGQHFDMTYYTDYIISESWMGNVDWPGNNIKIYRSNTTNNRWRFATIDLELSLNPNAWTDCYTNHIDYMSGQSTDNPYINIWLQSIQNTLYKNYFINRFADLMNTNYRPERLIAVENRYFNLNAPEMPNEYQRWGDAGNVPGQMDNFYNNHMTFQSELLCRTEQVRDHIQNRFALPQQVDVTLDVLPLGSGKIHISTIQPTEYPWTGVYFDGVPVKIEAIANPGFEFAYWDNSSLIADILDSVWEGNISLNIAQFTAHFQSNVNVNEEEETVFKIYPSPAQDYIQVVAEAQFRGFTYSIFDIQGKLIHSGNMQNQGSTRIDVSQFSTGMYAIQISDSSKGIVAKKIFVKE
ncbi:MAG: CotH kinase family protein, partial [Sediminibacterium sp.]